MTWLINPYRFGVSAGPGPDPEGHRWWGFRVFGARTTGAFFTCIANVEMALTPGGANQCSGGVSLGFPALAPGTGDALFDNDPATYEQNTQSPFYRSAGYCFDAPKLITEFRLQAPAANADRTPTAIQPISSADGETWVYYEPQITMGDWTPGSWRAFSVSTLIARTRATARIWRLDIDTSGGADDYFTELAFDGVNSETVNHLANSETNGGAGTWNLFDDIYRAHGQWIGAPQRSVILSQDTPPNPGSITIRAGWYIYDDNNFTGTVSWTADLNTWHPVRTFSTGVLWEDPLNLESDKYIIGL